MGVGLRGVAEVVADGVPRAAAVVRTLDELAEPPGRLRGVEPVRVGRRALDVVDLPAAEVRPADVPLLAVPVRREDERPLAGPDRYSHSVHLPDPFLPSTLGGDTVTHF